VSTRAAAESAARAGFAVTAIDAFADLDQHDGVTALALPRNPGKRFSAANVAAAAHGIACDAVVYLSPFENHPRSVDRLARHRALWGNAPAVLRRARDPLLVANALRDRGLPYLRVRTAAGSNAPNDPNDPNDPPWLLKPLQSGGGNRIRTARSGERIPRGMYLQERATGTPGSVLFVAAGGCAVPLGVSRQLIGDTAFGSTAFRYCGNIVSPAGLFPGAGEALPSTIRSLVAAVADEFSLVGINGIDFVVRDDVPFVVEVNPRWSAAAELVERAYGVSLFRLHAAACAAGTLPAFDVSRSPLRAQALGKAVVFAREDVMVGDTRRWLEDESVRDVPHPHERIAAGHPICTVFAEGRDTRECMAALARRAECIYEELEQRRVS
jgi:predicted ATP-grasp superfamily ATP-dependent carboligase